MSTELPITLIEATGPIAKVPDRQGRKASEYRIPVRYTVESGETFESAVFRSKLGDARAELATLPTVPTRPTKAIIQDGRFIGIQVTYRIGR